MPPPTPTLPAFSPAAENALATYEWPGNVRELRNAIERAVILWPSPIIEPEAFPERIAESAGRGSAIMVGGDVSVEDIERAQRCYRRALECNPLRQSAREALADTTAFDPAAHRESVEAHKGLLERNPGRRSSWRSLSSRCTSGGCAERSRLRNAASTSPT